VNNLFFGNDAGDYSLSTGQTPVGTIDQDPMLVDYKGDGSGDYHLAAGSPCVDHGVQSNAPTDDMDGSARPFGPAWDIGPYEWGPTANAGRGGSGAAGPAGSSGVGASSGTAVVGSGGGAVGGVGTVGAGGAVGAGGGSDAADAAGLEGSCGCRQ